jgi:hypothetical protein
MGKAVRQLGHMKSNLSKTEFKRRLTQQTSKEKAFFLVTPFNFSGTAFCGTFDDSKFDLTRNSFWIHVKAIEIKGEYQQADNKTTEVIYTIGISKFFKQFSWTAFGLGIIAFNTILFVFRDRTPISTFLTINGFFVFAYLWFLTVNWITTRLVNQRFQNEFEIGIEDEWEKLARSTTEEQRL